jgi:pimeloyl-ACP methyl ester carboxylesterase
LDVARYHAYDRTVEMHIGGIEPPQQRIPLGISERALSSLISICRTRPEWGAITHNQDLKPQAPTNNQKQRREFLMSESSIKPIGMSVKTRSLPGIVWKKCSLTIALSILAVTLASPAVGHAEKEMDCREVTASVPIADGGASNYSIAGTLCQPVRKKVSETVQLLVHGGTHNRNYFNMQVQGSDYSYASAAAERGFATLSIDRLGAGSSSRPPSAEVTLDNGSVALHGVVSQLRSGELTGSAFKNVVWIGHGFGNIYAWKYAARYSDIDAYVVTSYLHKMKPSWSAHGNKALIPAGGQLDSGYLTTAPGTRGDLFYNSNADPAVIAEDEKHKDTLTVTELQQSAELGTLPPDQAPSASIRVPTLLMIGQDDNVFCGPPDGLDCAEGNVYATEKPYYPEAELTVEVIPQTGHASLLHRTAPQAQKTILHWIKAAHL